MNDLIDSLRGTLIVSCQAPVGEPLHGAIYMEAMARAAAIGGAAGIRANGPEDIAAIQAAVSLPILGIYKQQHPGSEVYITPTFESAREVAAAGADLIALDGTLRPRPHGETLADLIGRIHKELGIPVMADLSCLEDAEASAAAGADILATTLSGYTTHGRPTRPGPDLDLIAALAVHFDLPVVAEGRFFTPEEVTEAFARGAHAVVIGTAITRPQEITRRFVAATPAARTRPS